jgi:hypothetical protein
VLGIKGVTMAQKGQCDWPSTLISNANKGKET